ncbi:head completion protein [uncultured Caudovirales phage]|uniref:Head completion nuclease n=1 Tax=uncultured Caudovirales phage TaxID=2100421 RepID=A0A6J5KP15_9CAUD|nr:head completion protein [uncultured Caudovirales phage]
MSKFMQNKFVPKNPQKLIGQQSIMYRSSWEHTVMNFLDTHPSVIQWASESIRVNYINPLTGKRSQYVPDFLIIYQDKNGNRKHEIVEVKPRSQTLVEHAKSRYDKAAQIINMAKWAAALAWCKQNGMTFRILTEDDIYIRKGNTGKRR